MIRLRTKAETLILLSNQLRSAHILPIYLFTTKDWKVDKDKCLKSLFMQKWFKWPLIVRSSHNKEDKANKSYAGYFDSILNINNKEYLEKAINDVINSYKTKSTVNQIFIQPMLDDVKLSGVVFTHDISTSSPFYSINYNDTSSDTTSITSGNSKSSKSFFQHHRSKISPPKKLEVVINLAKELYQLFGEKPLDIEFAINKKNKCYLFQVRQLLIKGKKFSVLRHESLLKKISKSIESFSIRHPYLEGKKPIFGIMPDWNPAEMIGIRPRPLSLSLYQYLITDSTWAYQRDNYGYKNLRGIRLMHSFSGSPYIDVRASFNSLIPKTINDNLSEKLVNYYSETLKRKPYLHDKIEFEIVFASYNFGTKNKIEELLKHGFTKNETNILKKELLNLSNNIIFNKSNLWKDDLNKIKELDLRRKKIISSKLLENEKIFWLLEDCRRYGTLPFVGLARIGFIAIDLLNSMIEKKLLTKERSEHFLSSLKTITSDFTNDLKILNKKKFLEKYGHLRPGTYDIRSLRYDENYDTYFKSKPSSKTKIKSERFKLTGNEEKVINKSLNLEGFKFDAKTLLGFIKNGVQAREYAKFEFTKNLSESLKVLSRMGQKFGLSREECSFIDILIINETINSNKSINFLMKESIKKGKKRFKDTESLCLPPLIFNKNDVWSYSQLRSQPNFITQKIIEGEILVIDEKKIKLDNKIIFIPSADPGYDWIFTYNIIGLITKYGGANSHMSIRANELGVPSIIGAGDQYYNDWKNNKRLLIDCSKKKVEIII
tara:strand:+ start:2362 stop:4683 length:2322 start_codon:yes stop_codon:yes gene_type:complete